jgi:hypothetical protein
MFSLISSVHGGWLLMLILLFCYTVRLWTMLPTFRRYILLPFSGSKCVGSGISVCIYIYTFRKYMLPPYSRLKRVGWWVSVYTNSPTHTLRPWTCTYETSASSSTTTRSNNRRTELTPIVVQYMYVGHRPLPEVYLIHDVSGVGCASSFVWFVVIIMTLLLFLFIYFKIGDDDWERTPS